MAYSDNTHLVVLDCGHSPVFRGAAPPVKGDTILCTKCQQAAIVLDAPGEWRYQCTACSAGRKYGRAQESAIMGGIKHARRRSHIVRIYDGNIVSRTVGTGEQRLPMAEPGAPPPY